MRSFFAYIVAMVFLVLADAVAARLAIVTGIKPDVFLAATVFTVLYRGHAPAVLTGFLLGLCADLLQPTVFGANALRLATVGYVLGWLHGRFNEDMPHVQAGMLVAASCLGILIMGLEALAVSSVSFGYSWRVAVMPPADALAGVPVIVLLAQILRRPDGTS